ncbi:methyl-accepting chemotaxis protein [Actinoplanes sp. TBRC 11911]|uniref:methyl-accepting chemotaxis protein n=1 Tax=Actinoplanes sp. TBRC 11911 TaxID=2729386 RepID=UPI00145F35F9|nr:methyl-accepting chemotaxis protein [Actinoplanes sp. TBRC 11911]NMO57375.1 methyl-accepting chemotaxis protein [Actinoplanes sp. TBRC 11911]
MSATTTTVTMPATGKGRNFIGDLGVQVKIGLIVGIGVLVAVVIGTISLHALSASATAAHNLYVNNVPSVRALGQVSTAMAQSRVDLAQQLISLDQTMTSKYAAEFKEDLNAVDTALADYHKSGPAAPDAQIAELESNWQKYADIAESTQLVNGERKDVKAWQTVRDQQTGPLFAEIDKQLTDLSAAESSDAATMAGKAQDGYESSRLRTILLLVFGGLAAIVIGGWIARVIVRSLRRVQAVCEGLADGDLTRTTGLESADEPGRMGRALDTAMHRLRQTVTTISASATSLAAASEQMEGVAHQIASSAEETSVQAQAVSAAAEEISRSVDTVSAGSEEMGASIREISQNASEAAQVAGEAVGLAARTSTTMNQLGESSNEIGNVIKTITAIAEQTNLLALNATIEAARAGEAGKGFAVVASEVKDLAQETARATEDISRRVEAIQADTGGAVIAIEEISRVIARISDFQTTIASAVEEQTATTAEMSRSVSEAATGTNEISQNITGVAEAARLTTEGVQQSQQATGDLARMSAELTSLVSTFRY